MAACSTPGSVGQAGLEPPEQLDPLRVGVEARLRERQGGGEHAVGVPAGGALEQAGEAALEDRRAAEQHEGERDLGDDQGLADAVVAAARAGAARLLLQDRVDVGARGEPRGGEPEEHAGEQRDPQREREDRAVEADVQLAAAGEELPLDDPVQGEGESRPSAPPPRASRTDSSSCCATGGGARRRGRRAPRVRACRRWRGRAGGWRDWRRR